MIRFLRHEDDTRDVRQQLGAGQIVQNDLLPIIIQHGQDKALFDACIRYKHSHKHLELDMHADGEGAALKQFSNIL